MIAATVKNNDFCRESKVYLNCDQGVGLEKTVAVADGEIEERLHYVRQLALVCYRCVYALCMVVCMY
jgi:hypothetical protein